jgi:hypothetical protein
MLRRDLRLQIADVAAAAAGNGTPASTRQQLDVCSLSVVLSNHAMIQTFCRCWERCTWFIAHGCRCLAIVAFACAQVLSKLSRVLGVTLRKNPGPSAK